LSLSLVWLGVVAVACWTRDCKVAGSTLARWTAS